MAALLVAAVVALGIAGAASAREIHVDCSAVVNGDGTVDAPLNTIAWRFELRPDQHLLFRRGTTCEGTLRVASGDNGAMRASVGAYGDGPLPRIVGTGRDAVRLEDPSNLTVRDLDISNPGSGGPLGEGDQIRNGLRVTAQSEAVRNLVLRDLLIHDVDGDLTKNPEGSAAIQVSATGPTPMRFEDLLISGNRITSVSRSAISLTGTNDPNRPDADQPWPNASRGVVIEDNRIDLVAGDGIVTRGTDGAVIRGNVVSRGNLAGRPVLDPAGAMCNAGIWAFRANNTVIRGNEVFGMEHNGCDGTGFNVDYRQDGTVVEGNYSHDNEGGFILLCTDEATHRADVRFNLSVDDGAMINHGPCGITEGILGDLSGIRVFNNTVVSDDPAVTIQLAPVESLYQPGTFRFENNLLYARTLADRIPCGDYCSHNAFLNLPPSGSSPLTADPLLAGPLVGGEGMAAANGFKLQEGSPLRGAGTQVPSSGPGDFFGHPIPERPSIGFDQEVIPIRPGIPPACRKATKVRDIAWKRAKVRRKALNRLRRQRAGRARIVRAHRKLRRARAVAKRRSAAARRACRPV